MLIIVGGEKMEGSTLAYALACGLSTGSRRPILGEITININKFDFNNRV